MIAPRTIHEEIIDCKVSMTVDEYNKRIRIDDYSGNVENVMLAAETKTMQLKGEKLIVKVRQEELDYFIGHGYVVEGIVDRYFSGKSMYFVCKYFKSARRNSKDWREEDETLQVIMNSSQSNAVNSLSKCKLLICTENDAEQLATLYKSIFTIYPVPIFDPNYIKKCMQGGSLFLAYLYEEKMISAVCAEMNAVYQNAEITDCATLPEYRKYKCMQQLIAMLEAELLKRNIQCFYSIARAKSYGMNAVLHRLKYRYRGRLANNCYIYNDLEDMNIWVKNVDC